jgi:hypothetical protein
VADNIKNVHLLQADMVDYNSLNAAATEAAKTTRGSLGYLIVNNTLIDRSTQDQAG